MAKSTISLVSVQKPTTNTPVLQRRNKMRDDGAVKFDIHNGHWLAS